MILDGELLKYLYDVIYINLDFLKVLVWKIREILEYLEDKYNFLFCIKVFIVVFFILWGKNL